MTAGVIDAGSVLRWLTLGTALCLIASGYVYVRNLQVQKGHEIRDLESRIAVLHQEIEWNEIQRDALRTRSRLREVIREEGEALQRIDPFDPLCIPMTNDPATGEEEWAWNR